MTEGRRAGEHEQIALFPLGTVLLPGLMLPLHVFEPRYRRLLDDLAAREPADRFFGVLAIRAGHEVGATGVRALHEVGTTAALRETNRLPDGRADVITEGVRRFRLVRLVEGRPYLQGEVEWLAEADGDGADALAPVVRQRLDGYLHAVHRVGGRDPGTTAEPSAHARALSYRVAAAMVLDLPERQGLLAAADTAERLRAELALLHRETALLRLLPSLPAVSLAGVPVTPN